MDGLLFNMGHLILQERHLLCFTWPTHTPTSLRGTAGLADLFGGFAIPDTPLPTCFGIPPAPVTIWYTMEVSEKVCHEGGRVWPLLCGWHFERCRLSPTIKGLHHFRLPRAMRLCTDQITLAYWGYSCTTLQGWFSLTLNVPATASWKQISSECWPAPKGIYETYVIKHS